MKCKIYYSINVLRCSVISFQKDITSYMLYTLILIVLISKYK